MTKKLSQISSGGALASTDTIVAVRNGTSDVLVSLSTVINAQTGVTYTVAATDAGKLITFSNTSAIAVTLPVATSAGFTAGFSFQVTNINTGPVTITPTTSTINGGSALILQKGDSVTVVSDGSNYQVNALTTKVPVSGTFANRPASPTTGQLYYATDINILIMFDGSKWKPASGSGVILNNIAYHSAAGTGAEANYYIATIPANLLSSTGALRIYAQNKYSGTTAAKTILWRISSTSGDTSGGTQIVNTNNGGSSTSLTASACHILHNNGATNAQASLPSGNAILGGYNSSSSVITPAIDTTATWYINFNGSANAADTFGYEGVIIEWIES